MKVAVDLAQAVTQRLKPPTPTVGHLFNSTQLNLSHVGQISWVTVGKAHDAFAVTH